MQHLESSKLSSTGPRVVVMTGAGISADSGVRTFRDHGGLWEGHRPEDVATPQAWRRERKVVWRFYQQRRAQLREVSPNPGHAALVALEQRVRAAGGEFTLVTQNVDDLHERAGSRPIHMHGELAWLRCERCERRLHDLEQVDPDRFVRCDACGHDALRPDIVWFGEMPYHLESIELAVSTCSDFIAVGTSGVVWPAAGYLHEARRLGARTWVQSLDAPENLDPSDRFRPGRAAVAVPALVDELALELGLR
jgi:NAD-dependent deacetylase